MSDVMLLGILRMPLDDTPEGLGVIAWTQIKSVMREAANRIEADAIRIAELEAALRPFTDVERIVPFFHDAGWGLYAHVVTKRDMEAARAALEKKDA